MSIRDNKAKELKSNITPEFLALLVECAKVVGWGVDFIEVKEFVSEVHTIAGVPEPTNADIEPYPYDDEDA